MSAFLVLAVAVERYLGLCHRAACKFTRGVIYAIVASAFLYACVFGVFNSLTNSMSQWEFHPDFDKLTAKINKDCFQSQHLRSYYKDFSLSSMSSRLINRLHDERKCIGEKNVTEMFKDDPLASYILWKVHKTDTCKRSFGIVNESTTRFLDLAIFSLHPIIFFAILTLYSLIYRHLKTSRPQRLQNLLMSRSLALLSRMKSAKHRVMNVKKAAMFFMVALVFFSMYTPVAVLLADLVDPEVGGWMTYPSYCLFYMKCAVSPVIYFSMGELYRKRMLELLTFGWCDVTAIEELQPIEERSDVVEKSTVQTDVTSTCAPSTSNVTKKPVLKHTIVNGKFDRRHSSRV